MVNESPSTREGLIVLKLTSQCVEFRAVSLVLANEAIFSACNICSTCSNKRTKAEGA